MKKKERITKRKNATTFYVSIKTRRGVGRLYGDRQKEAIEGGKEGNIPLGVAGIENVCPFSGNYFD